MTYDEFMQKEAGIRELPVEEQKAVYKRLLREETDKTEYRIHLCFDYGRLCYLLGDFRKTIEILEPILLDYQSYPYTPKLISCCNLMGVATHCETEYSVSRYYYKIALKLAQEKKDEYYYAYEYNNISITYIMQNNYEKTLECIRMAEKYLERSDEEMGAYIYANKAGLLTKMNQLPEALEAYDLCVNHYQAERFIPDDALLCGATLYYKLGDKEKYEDFKKKILEKMDEMYAAEFMDSCRELFECGLDSGDDELVERILESMDRYMTKHPKEIKVGITVADLKYVYAQKKEDKDAILAALEAQNYYKGEIIRYSEEKRVQSLNEFADINTQLQKAIESKERAVLAKSQFLANMSHDIRTPINGIMGMLNIIRKSKDSPERIEDCLDKIEVSSKLLLSLVNDVLDMTKLETDSVILNREPVDLDRVCQEATDAVAFQAEEAGLRISSEHDDFSGVFVWGSELHLKKILINLFSNSIKYNKPGGAIHTTMRIQEQTEDRMVCKFTIEDTGIGMTQDFIDHKLFKPFIQADNSSRSSYMGTGLGMAIVKQLIEKMGGTIQVESKIGEGSLFTVVLPFEIDRKQEVQETEDEKEADISGLRFLVAEDNDLNMEIVEFLLTEQGASIVPVQNGLDAVRRFEESEPGTFDAILMDLMMPVMDGLTATKRIRSLKHPEAKTIPIIAMTANAFAEDAKKCLEAGMNAHLAKPLDMDKMIGTIARICNSK